MSEIVIRERDGSLTAHQLQQPRRRPQAERDRLSVEAVGTLFGVHDPAEVRQVVKEWMAKTGQRVRIYKRDGELVGYHRTDVEALNRARQEKFPGVAQPPPSPPPADHHGEAVRKRAAAYFASKAKAEGAVELSNEDPPVWSRKHRGVEARTTRAAQALGIERADATDTDRRARRVAAAIGSDQAEPDPTLSQRTAEAAARIGIDPATVGAKREKTAVDDRAAEAAKLIGLPGYPSGSSE